MRLAAQAKGGYYPTPDRVVDLIAELIHTPSGSYNREPGDHPHPRPLLRGRGRAPEAVAENLDPAQLDFHRDLRRGAAPGPGGGGREAAPPRTLAADLFATSIANGAFGLLLPQPAL